MSAAWKTVLHDYVRHRNQIETDYNLEPLLPLVADRKFIERLRSRMERVRERQQHRDVVPLQTETKLRILKCREGDETVSAEIELRRTMRYRIGQTDYDEERCERETVVCGRRGDRWTIASIEPGIENRQPVHIHDEPVDRMESVPYLSPAVYAGYEHAYRSRRYNRMKVKEYADMYWNSPNPQYENFAVDCTNYVSQCLFAGGMPMHYTGKREAGWWYQGLLQKQEQWSYSWAVSNSIASWLSGRNTGLPVVKAESASELAIGDVITYDWDGSGRFQHSTIVTGADKFGQPLVNAHTVNSRGRYWDYRDSYAWTANTRYSFFHIADTV